LVVAVNLGGSILLISVICSWPCRRQHPTKTTPSFINSLWVMFMLSTPHRFYSWSRTKQNLFLFFCYSLFFLIILLSFSGLFFGHIWSLCLFPLIFIPAQLVDTPTGMRRGRLLYFSPLFLVEQDKDNNFILHGGSLFDFLFVFKWHDAGETARRRLVTDFLSGLLAFTHYLKANDLGDAVVKGSSYFFSYRNAKRYGFDVDSTAQSQQIILSMNYIVILATYSFTRGKLALPPISHMKTVQSTGATLIKHQERLSSSLTRIQHQFN